MTPKPARAATSRFWYRFTQRNGPGVLCGTPRHDALTIR